MKRRTEETLERILNEFKDGTFLNTDLELIGDDEAFVERKFPIYAKKKLLRLKFHHHIRSHQTVDRFVSSLIPPKVNQRWYYGDGWSGSTSFRG